MAREEGEDDGSLRKSPFFMYCYGAVYISERPSTVHPPIVMMQGDSVAPDSLPHVGCCRVHRIIIACGLVHFTLYTPILRTCYILLYHIYDPRSHSKEGRCNRARFVCGFMFIELKLPRAPAHSRWSTSKHITLQRM